VGLSRWRSFPLLSGFLQGLSNSLGPTPVPKTVFVTKVGDLGCGVGYYN
jgi:hypothetical protein